MAEILYRKVTYVFNYTILMVKQALKSELCSFVNLSESLANQVLIITCTLFLFVSYLLLD